MSQAQNPHPQLVAVRCRVQESGVSRSHAAALCGTLTNDQCELILAAASVDDIEEVLAPAKALIDPEPVLVSVQSTPVVNQPTKAAVKKTK